MSESIKAIIASVKKLAQMDPQHEAVEATVSGLQEQIALLNSQTKDAQKGSFVKESMKDDAAALNNQIDKLHAAASVPASNYARILSITAGLKKAAILAQRPQNAVVRPRLAAIIAKTAGVFAEVDTVQDLDKPLEQIEKAIHSLYGNQSLNSAYMFDRRGKGHHTNKAE